jgi:glycosyltransferase involved in cell wall biosynthesis
VPQPKVSVVVATHDRPARLERLLDALARQELGREQFEVIVVDDGSGPTTQALLERRAGAADLELRVLRQPIARGPGSARNAGWRSARATLVAFTDDDCVPRPSWLQAGLAAHEAQPEAIVQGATRPDPSELHNDGLLSRTLSVERLGPAYETCNIFYPRAVLESLGGFDEHFGLTPGGEDSDLAWRAIEAGRPAVFAPDAVVLHAVEPLGVRGKLRVAARWSGSVRIYAEHPQTRAMLKQGLFWNVWHYLMLRSLAALLMPPWLRRMVLTWHLLELRRRARRAGAGPWGVAFLIVHDLVELLAVLRGAVRYRTLVL